MKNKKLVALYVRINGVEKSWMDPANQVTLTDSEREMNSRFEREAAQTQADHYMAEGSFSDPDMQGIEAYPEASHPDGYNCAISEQKGQGESQYPFPGGDASEIQKRLQHDSQVNFLSMPELQDVLDPLGIQATSTDPYKAETSRYIERWFAANPQL